MPAGRLIGFFRTRPDLPVTATAEEAARSYRRRSRVTLAGITLGYAVFYTTRLNLSMAKKPILDEGLVSADDLGSIGSMLLLAYALGKVVNGFVADRAHVGRLMGAGLVTSALANLAFGFSHGVWLLAALWFVNGWCQSMGATPSIVNLSHWFSHRERGTRYSIWSCAHSLGEGGHLWLDRCALAACGYALGGLLVLLGGLGVVDVCPRGASGAAVGVAGFCCYLGASLQDKISGRLIDAGRTLVDGAVRYDFTRPLQYWLGAAILSTLLSSVLWRTGARGLTPPARSAAAR